MNGILNQHLMTGVGGRGTLYNLWVRLKRTNRVVLSKRKRGDTDSKGKDKLRDSNTAKVIDSSVGGTTVIANGRLKK